ncbi:hypothetical protein BVY04_02305 [bacterium M21]|nr:hypothetical protein BVY04_02305 [bacterium M21]
MNAFRVIHFSSVFLSSYLLISGVSVFANEVPRLSVETEQKAPPEHDLYQIRKTFKRGNNVILIDEKKGPTAQLANRGQTVTVDGKEVYNITSAEGKSVKRSTCDKFNIVETDENGDGKSDFLFIGERDSTDIIEGFRIQNDRYLAPLSSQFLLGPKGGRLSYQGIIERVNTDVFEYSVSGDSSALKKILSFGISPNITDKDGLTPLHLSAQNGHMKAVHVLLKHGAFIHVEDKTGRLPYDLSRAKNHTAISEYLFNHENNWINLVDLEPESTRVDYGKFHRIPLGGDGLRIAGKNYRTALDAHANSVIQYNLGGAYDSFATSYGLKEGAYGRVKFSIIVDGTSVFESGVVRSNDGSTRAGHEGVTISLKDSNVLELVATGVGSINGAWTAWGNPRIRLSKQRFFYKDIELLRSTEKLDSFYLTGNDKLLVVGDDRAIHSSPTQAGEWTQTPLELEGFSGKTTAWIGTIQTLAFAKGSSIMLTKFPDGTTQTIKGKAHTIRVLYAPKEKDMLIVGTSRKSIEVWQPSTSKLLWEYKGLSQNSKSVAFNSQKNELAIGLSGGEIVILNADTGQLLHKLHGHTYMVSSLAYSPAGDQLVSGSYDLTLMVWDCSNYKSLGQFVAHGGLVKKVIYLRDNLAASADTDGKVIIWKTRTQETVQRLQAVDSIITDLIADEHSNRLFICSHEQIKALYYKKKESNK